MGPAPWTPGPGRLLPHSRNSGRTDLAAPAALAGEYKSQQLPPGWGSGRCPRHAPQTGPSDGPDLPHGTLDLAELERMITRGLRSPSHQVCELICLENSHSTLRGPGPLHRLPTPSRPGPTTVHLLAQTYKAQVHLDGAQLMNTALALHVPPPTLWSTVTLSFCLSKVGKPWAGLPQQVGRGAPAGGSVGFLSSIPGSRPQVPL
ncbi:probable low-specificity L-threonine aldolase 1 isoform X2 [Piliocolobus tephrosceles]|uniref:probable low-specificity L-threonine aldolase 1 isoform X2 n=1 Tax=Piliocolobus tephrosceles TaxID=591936 RepID=UPI000C2B1D0F|nr:probable low-specificity L-threonine aldolase 1 isoform X2 [Piliocolobus tephrosceles]